MPLSAWKERFPWRLFLAFTALDCFRYFFLRASEWSLGYTTVPAFFEPIRLPYYFAIFAGTLFALVLGKRLEALRGPAYNVVSLVLMLACASFSLWLSGVMKLVLMFAGFFMVAAQTCLCMRSIALSAPFAFIGRFVAFSFACANFLGSAFLFMDKAPLTAHAFVLALLALGVMPLNMTEPENTALSEADESRLEPTPRCAVRSFCAVLAIYSFIAGVLYNIFFVIEGKANEPGLYFLVLAASTAIYIVTGVLLDRAQWSVTVISLFALITAGQSLSYFFTSESVLALPFSYITMGGFIAMDAVTIIIPLYYVKKREKPHLAGFGYAFLYGGLFVTSLLLRFAPESLHRAVLAGMLIASPAAMLLVVVINSAFSKAKFEHTIKMIGTTVAPNWGRGDSQSDAFRRHGFTNREAEALRLLLEGSTNKLIAEKMMVTENTVYKYISSMMSKADVKSRSALIAIFSQSKY